MLSLHVVRLSAAVLVGLMMAPVAGMAQEQATLEGAVTDAEQEEPLEGANVILESTSKGVSADAEGRYMLRDIEPGTYLFKVSHVGYATFYSELTLEPGEHRTLNVALEQEEVEAGEVVVTGAVEEEAERAVGVSRVPIQFVQDLPAVLEEDVFRSLQLLPGVQAASDYSSGLYIRGGSPDQTLVRFDHATLYNPTHAFGFFSTFNPDAVDAVDVYKGIFPSRYGGRLGSVVDISSREGSRERTAGGLSLGLLASRAFLEGPLGGGSYLVTARRSTLEPVLAAFNQTEIEGIPERFHFFDVNARLDLRPSRSDRLTLSLFGGRDVLYFPFLEDEATFDIAYGSQMASLSWAHAFSGRLSSRLTAAASRYVSDPRAVVATTEVVQHNRVADGLVSAALEWEPSDRHFVEIGLQAGGIDTGVSNRFEETTTFDHDSRLLYGSGYVQDAFWLGRRWKVEAGFRAGYFSEGDHLRVAPRLTLEYRPAEALRLQAGYGRYYQFLGLETNETVSAFDQWLPGADGVAPSTGDQLVAGLKLGRAGALTLDVEGYARTMEHLFRLNPFLPDHTEVDYAAGFIFGEGYAYGAEILLRRQKGMLNGYVGYTYGVTRRRFSEINYGQLYPPTYDRTHDVNVVANLDLTPQWRLTGVFRLASGQAYTRAQGQYRMVDEPLVRDGPRNRVAVIDARFNADRLPPYHRLDLGITRRGGTPGRLEYELQVQVVNAYSQRNVWFYYFDADTAGRPEQIEIPQIPVMLPNVSLSLRF